MAVCTAASTDANGWNLEFGSDLSSQFGRDFFQNNTKTTCIFKHMGIVNETGCFVLLGGTDGIGAKLVDTLWGETKMAHHRNTGRENTANRLEDFFSTFELDSVGTRFFHDTDGRGKSLF